MLKLAAWRIATALRVISFGFDESTKFGHGLMSTNVQLEPREAPGTSIDVVPRARLPPLDGREHFGHDAANAQP